MFEIDCGFCFFVVVIFRGEAVWFSVDEICGAFDFPIGVVH